MAQLATLIVARKSKITAIMEAIHQLIQHTILPSINCSQAV